MSTEITHERCSELLRRYVGGELEDDAATDVSRHLQSCDDCRQELAAIKALVDYDYEGLTGTEVVRLDRAITEEMRGEASRTATVVPFEPVSEPRRGIAGIALGVAAATLVVVVAIGSFMSGESDNDTGDAGVAAEDAGGAGGGGDGGGPRPVFVANPRPNALVSAFSLNSEAATEDNERTQKGARFSGILVQRDLERLGHSNLFDRFAAAYDVEDADVLRDDFVAELAHEAGKDAGTVTLCVRNVLNESTGPALPVAGTYGRFDGRPVLVTGFVYTDQEEGPLNLYSIFVWPRGSCDTPLTTGGGKVR